jgi:hypothetical protein
MITATVDASRAKSALGSLYDALIAKGKDASHVVEDETKLLARTIVNFTPPLGMRGGARQTGEGAVSREIKNLVSEATPNLIDEVGSKYGVRNISTAYVAEKSGAKLNLLWDYLDPTGGRIEELHEQFRHDGKVPLTPREAQGVWQSRVIVPTGVRDPYIRKKQRNVGIWKATWALVAARLGDSFPNWISRHFGKRLEGTLAIVDLSKLQDEMHPTITFGSRAPGNSKIRRHVQDAVQARAKAIAKKVQLILSDYKADIVQDAKAKAAARRHRTEQVPINE